MKRYICLALCFVMVVGMFCMLGWTTGNVWTLPAFDKDTPSNYPTKDTTIAKNSKFELIWKAEDATVDLIELATGNRWGVTARDPDAPTTDQFGLPIKFPSKISSLVMVEYVNMQTNVTGTLSTKVEALQDGRIVTESIDNGYRIYYYFDVAEIRVAVDVVLHEDHVSFTVDPHLMQENDTNKIVGVKIAPFWCFNPNDDKDAYLFYPSGSGTIVSNETNATTGIGFSCEAPVYGNDYAVPLKNLEGTFKEIRLPVYGSVSGGTGTLAIIEQNAESASIGVEAGFTNVSVSGVYSNFAIRGSAKNAIKNMDNYGTEALVYAVSPTDKASTVGFYPLTGDKASYSGMAETYREYLKKTGQLTETLKEESPLNVTFIGGVMVDQSFLGVPYKDLVAATTIEDAKSILSELSDKTNGKISAKLLGFGSSGIENGDYAGGIKIHKNVGDKKDLAALAKYSKENNIDLYYDFDLVRLKNGSSGFSTIFDVAYSPLLKIATAYQYHASSRSFVEETGYNLLKRELLNKGADKVLKGIKDWGLNGVSLESLSQIAYSDCSTETTEYMVKGFMGRDVTDIFGKFKKNYKVASEDANAYAAVISDVIFNSPSSSSGEANFMYDVPFYQMVFKGYVPMSSESINLALDPDKEILKAVEAGSGLGYTLIADYYNEFIDYRGYAFFGSKYSDISDDIISTANKLEGYYSAIAGAEIKSHTILDSGLRETVYSNGVKAYVNYTDKDIVTEDGSTVPAKGYNWVK